MIENTQGEESVPDEEKDGEDKSTIPHKSKKK